MSPSVQRRSHSSADVRQRPSSSTTRPTTQEIASAAVTRLFQTRQQTKLKEARQQRGGRPPWQESFASKSHTTEADIGTMRSSQFASSESKSRFMVAAKKQFHEIEIPADAKSKLQNIQPSLLDQHIEYQKAIHILRHEEGLAKRRVLDGFLNLTAAQLDTHLTLPNQSYADRHSHDASSWVLNNDYRQQVDPAAGVPVMTRIMRGDYYVPPPAPRREITNFIATNRMHVTAASAVSRLVPVVPAKHNRRTCAPAGESARSHSSAR
jgi:hypothetical protein